MQRARMSLHQRWNELVAAINATLPTPIAQFLSPEEGAIERIEDALGLDLPADLREYFSFTGGQDDSDEITGSLQFAHFLTPTEVIEALEIARDDLEIDPLPLTQPAYYIDASWTRGWLPILGFQGDMYIVDLSPGELGTAGQVFFRPNVPELGEPIAASLEEFFALVTRSITDGEAEVEDGTLLLDILD